MESALGFNYTSPMILVMKEVKYESIEDIVTMDQEEAMKLSYGVVNSQDSVTIEVHFKSKKKLLYVLWLRHHDASCRLVTTDDWM